MESMSIALTPLQLAPVVDAADEHVHAEGLGDIHVPETGSEVLIPHAGREQHNGHLREGAQRGERPL